MSTPDYQPQLPDYPESIKPYTFTSCLCREQHFRMPLYQFWCDVLKERKRFSRKQWEYVYIMHVLYERKYLDRASEKRGMNALGFGVGKEPIVAALANYGLEVLATDLDLDNAKTLGWVDTNQHSNNLDHLNDRGICRPNLFNEYVKFQNMDMNNIPDNIGEYNIIWSSCAFEHLGSISKGIDFVINSSKHLKSGGIAIHTTEYNISSNTDTLDNNNGYVIFRKRDIEEIKQRLENEGFIVDTIDYEEGTDRLEKHIDMPPYSSDYHIRLQLADKYVATSIGIIITKP